MVWFFNKNKKDDKKPEQEDVQDLPLVEEEILEEDAISEEPVEELSKPEDLLETTDENIEESKEEIFDLSDETPKVIEEEPEEKKSWFGRLTEGLSKSSNKITSGISSVLTKRKLDDELIEELEEILIMADLGPKTAHKLVSDLAKDRFGKDITDVEVKQILSDIVAGILEPVAKPLKVNAEHKPFVILMVGVNGAGKTTTIGKIGNILKAEGKSVMMAAGDTFRAAAIEQLTVWGERSNIPVFSKTIGSDAAALAYEAYEKAKADNIDVLIIDTAGRLQNKTNLMEELSKIVRVLKKHDETAPHGRLIVLDATTGQNAHSQIDAFKQTVDLTGLIVTKLDGSAKGGVIVSLADQFELPIHAVGVGESIEDLKPFKAPDFARSLMGLEDKDAV